MNRTTLPMDAQLNRPYLPAFSEQHEIDQLLTQGVLRRLCGTTVVGMHIPYTPALRAESVCVFLGTPPPSSPAAIAHFGVLGYETAAWIHTGAQPPVRPDIIITPKSARSRTRDRRQFEHRLAAADVMMVGQVPVTTPCRTAADVARITPPPDCRLWLDRLAGLCDVTPEDLEHQLDYMLGARWIKRARQQICDWATLSAAPLAAQ